jgi:FtsH-binding integral membrane protein
MASIDQHIQKLLNFSHIDKHVQVHLKKVYSCLAVSMLTAALGAYIHLIGLWQAGLLTFIGSIGFLLAMMMTEHKPQNLGKRFGYMIGFALCSGLSLGPLIDMVGLIDPSILPTAFLGTCVIFACFTLASLMSTDRKFLYLGGFLMSGLSWLFMLSLMNIFFGSRLLFEFNLYAGLFIFCGFVLYDTQLIIEKKRMGNDDYLWHSVELFIDFINIFRRLLIILASKEKKKRND